MTVAVLGSAGMVAAPNLACAHAVAAAGGALGLADDGTVVSIEHAHRAAPAMTQTTRRIT
jgi:hypothetical protein